MEFTDAERRVIMIPLILGGFVALLNETILNVAVPSLMESLKVSTSTVQWLSTGYMLIIGILVPVVAFLLENFTTRKLYLFAMGLFLFGTVCCGFANHFPCCCFPSHSGSWYGHAHPDHDEHDYGHVSAGKTRQRHGFERAGHGLRLRP